MRSSVSLAASGNGTLGHLHIKAVLDHPKKIHYGAEDPVRGKVVAKYVCPSRTGASQLFGPLEVEVVLKGQIRINHDHEPTHLARLFTNAQNVHSGAFRADSEREHYFPFTLHFPENADADRLTTMTQNENGSWSFSQSTGTAMNALPPSLESYTGDAASISKSKSTPRNLVEVKYSLAVRAKMPGIDVDLVIANPVEGETICYDKPRVPMMIANNLDDTNEFFRTLTVQNEDLRTGDERPHGFMRKTKALLKSPELPKFVFTVTCSAIPQHVFVGQPSFFEVAVAPHFSSTTRLNPEVFLDSCTTTLIARTGGVKPANIETLRSQEVTVGRKPFSDQHGWNQTIDLGVLSWLPSTFSFGDIERTYKLRIVCQFSIGKQNLGVRQDIPIMAHPPVESECVNSLARINSGGSALPAYEEAVAPPMALSYDADTGASQPSYEQFIRMEGTRHDRHADVMGREISLQNQPAMLAGVPS